jgi:hypothetical protein
MYVEPRTEDGMRRTVRGGFFSLALVAIVAAGVSVSAMPGEEPPPPTGCAAVELDPPSRENKVTQCHFTGSDSNPFIINQISVSAAESHVGHHGDCQVFFDGTEVCS